MFAKLTGGSTILYTTAPSICVPNDGAAGHGCNGLTDCAGGSSVCATDSRGNKFCSLPCTGSATCGNTGVSCCDASTFSNGANTACGICGNP